MHHKPHSVCQYPLPHIWASSHLIRCSTGICPWTCTLCSLQSFSFHCHWKALCPSPLIRQWLSQLQKYAAPHLTPGLLSMQKSTNDVKTSTTVNKLKSSDDKTKAMIVSSGRKSRSFSGIWPGKHISNLLRSASFELRCISFIRRLLSTDGINILVPAFVLSRFDYCNSLLSGCPQYLLNKLQKVKNNATRLVLRVPKTDHISLHLASLHWLPIDSRIQYKLASVCYNCLSSAAPVYLTELLTVHKPTRQLHSSSDTSILYLPSVLMHSLGQRSFSYAASYICLERCPLQS